MKSQTGVVASIQAGKTIACVSDSTPIPCRAAAFKAEHRACLGY